MALTRPAAPGAAPGVLARLHPLPSPRGVALEILRRSLRDDVSIADLARVAQGDPALAGRLLKAANAALGGGRAVATLQEAILRIGVPGAARLAIAFSLVGDHRGGPCRAFDYAAFWTASLLRGLAAQAFAAHLEAPAPDDAFCCGLLAQVGELAFATAQPDAYAAILEGEGSADPAERRRAERERFGLDHAELADALLADWGFPAALRQAVLSHRDPDAATGEGGPRVQLLARALQLGAAVATAAQAPPGRRAAATDLAAQFAEHLGIDATTLESLAARIADAARPWSALLQVAAPAAPLLEFEPAQADEAPGAAVPAADGEGERVLVVDRDAGRGTALARELAVHGYRATVARDGDEALTAYLVRRPNAVVADWSDGGIAGAALCRTLRATQAGDALYLVLVAPDRAPGRAAAGLEAGADDVLSRPLVAGDLLARLGSGLRSRRRCAQLERELDDLRRVAGDLAVDNRLLERTSRADRDTGLPDRREALERLAQACASASRRRAPVACLAIEPDAGVPRGPGGVQALRAFARLLRETARTGDTLCRVADAAFLLVAPDTDRNEAAALAARLRAAAVGMPGGAASIGIAAAPFGDCAPAELARRAEQALLAARLGGGDRAVEYGARVRRVV